jgi:hypothetical protein
MGVQLNNLGIKASYDGPYLLMLVSAGLFVLALPIGVYEIPEVLVAIGLFIWSSLQDNFLRQCRPWSGH